MSAARPERAVGRRDQPDVVVVGAGPAGSATALLLARAGIDVLLVDRARFPRAKPCGDCLSLEATRVLDRLGVLPAVSDQAPASLLGWRIVSPGGRSFDARFSAAGQGVTARPGALAMRRRDLDACLFQAAVGAGARTLSPATVESFEPGSPPRLRLRGEAGETIELVPRFVVGADGLRSRVARCAGRVRRGPRLRKFSLTLHVRDVVGVNELGEMHVSDGLCLGIAPVGRGTHNLTLVAGSRRHALEVRSGAGPFFARALRRFSALPAGLATATLDGVPLLDALACDSPGFLASGPFDVPCGSAAGRGFALAGDAAGYFDPFTGQGIYQALRGAELLAAALLPALARRRRHVGVLHGYGWKHRLLTKPSRLMQQGIDGVLARPALADAAIERLSRAPAAARAVLDATADVRSPFCLLSPGALLSFALPRARSWS
jgi:menaquinone-9 beta-reductase